MCSLSHVGVAPRVWWLAAHMCCRHRRAVPAARPSALRAWRRFALRRLYDNSWHRWGELLKAAKARAAECRVRGQAAARLRAKAQAKARLVALARAQLADPGLLVLDEATSAVDPETETTLERAMERLAAGRTTVSVAHRLSTAERADLVLVFDDGRIAESGQHDDLVAAGGVYAGLHASWLGGTRDSL